MFQGLINSSYRNGWLGKIIERLERKENRFAPLYMSSPEGGVQRYPYNYGAHINAYVADVWLYASIRAIAEAVSGIPLLVQRKTIVDSEDVWETVTGHPLSRLIEHPNPEVSMEYLLGMFVTNTYLTGNGYLHYDSTDNELYSLQSDWVKVVRDKQGKNPAYKVQKGVSSYDAELDEILHWKLPAPKDHNYGLPPSQVIRETIITKLALSGYLKNYFQNDATSGTTFSTDQTLTSAQREQLRQEFELVHRGYKNAHRIAILDSGSKLDKMANTIKELMPVELYRSMREEILAAYGVPHVMVGVLDDASYSNAEVQKQVFYENRIMPTLRAIEGIFNIQLVRQFDDNIRIHFDRTTIAPLQEDKEVQAKTLSMYVGSRIMTPNEARQEIGLEPLDGGDDLRVPMALPVQGSEDEPPSEGEEEEPEKGKLRINRLSSKMLTKEERWRVHYDYVKSLETDFALLMRKYFDSQLSRVLSRLGDIDKDDGQLSALWLYSEIRKMKSVKLDDGDTPHIFLIDEENKKLHKHVALTYETEISTAGEEAMRQHGITVGFNLNTPEVLVMLENSQNRLAKINDYTYKLIKNVLSEAYNEGWGIDEISKQIRGTYKDFSKSRSTRIAQTEMNSIVNGGHLQGGIQAGGEKKEWVSAMMPTSRPWHIDAQYQGLIPIKQRFIVGDSAMMYPSDPAGLAEDIINCHCSVITH